MPIVDGRERDRLDRLVPHRFDALTFARAIPGWLARFSPIPDSAFHSTTLEVDCPCGGAPHIDPETCLCQCQCGRVFLHAGKKCHVANSPVRTSARP